MASPLYQTLLNQLLYLAILYIFASCFKSLLCYVTPNQLHINLPPSKHLSKVIQLLPILSILVLTVNGPVLKGECGICEVPHWLIQQHHQ